MMVNALMSAMGMTPEAVKGHLQTVMSFMTTQDARLARIEAAQARIEGLFAEQALNTTALLQTELPPTIEGTSNAE